MLINTFKDWHLADITWLIIALITTIIIGSMMHSDWLTLTATLTGVLNLVLLAKGKLINYLFGIMNNITYALVAWHAHLYGQAILFMGYFLPMQFYGLYLWTRHENQQQGLIIAKRLVRSQWLLYGAAIVFSTIIYGMFLNYFGETQGWLDALATTLSIFAMWLMARLYLEQWLLWLLVNITTILLWWLNIAASEQWGKLPMLCLFTIYLINTGYGYGQWRRLAKH